MSIELIEKAAERIEQVADKQTQLAERMGALQAKVLELQQKGISAAGANLGIPPVNPLRKVMESPEFKAFADRDTKSVRIPLNVSIAALAGTKATLVQDIGDSDGAGIDVQPQRLQGLANDPRRRLWLMEAMPRIPVTSSAVSFNRLDSYSNAANYQSEQGDTKAEASVPSELVTCHIATIAHFLPIAEQVLADVPMLSAQLDSLLRYGVMRKLENELIVGAGNPGQIAGLTDSGNFTAFSPSTSTIDYADAIGEAIAQLDSAGWNANLIVLHPDDWQAMRSQRATTSNEYLVGSWANPAPPNVWGVRVVTSPALSAGNFIAMDTTQALLLDRQQATVELGYSGTGFVQNVITMRAELRAGLAVLSPSAVRYGALY